MSDDISYEITTGGWNNEKKYLSWKGPLTSGISWIRGTNVQFGSSVSMFCLEIYTNNNVVKNYLHEDCLVKIIDILKGNNKDYEVIKYNEIVKKAKEEYTNVPVKFNKNSKYYKSNYEEYLVVTNSEKLVNELQKVLTYATENNITFEWV